MGATDITRAIGARSSRRPHGRPLAHRPADRRASPPSTTGSHRRAGRRPVAADGVSATATRSRQRSTSSRHPTDFHEIEAPLTEEQARVRRGPLPRLRRLLRVPRVRAGLPRRRDRLRPRRRSARRSRSAPSSSRPASSSSRPTPSPSTASAGSRTSSPGMQMDRLLAPTRPFNTILRPGDGKVPERIAYILCTGSRDETGRQPAVLALLLHVLDQAEPADHGRPAARRRDHPLHGHAGRRQALRRVLRAGEGHGRARTSRAASRRSPRRRTATWSCATRTSRTAARSSRPSTTWSSSRSASSPTVRSRSSSSGESLGAGRVLLRRRGRTRTSTRAGPTSPASSWPGPASGRQGHRGLDPARGCGGGPGRRAPRARQGDGRGGRHERGAAGEQGSDPRADVRARDQATHRRLHLPLRRQHLRLRRRRGRRGRARATTRTSWSPRPRCSPAPTAPSTR